MTEELKKIAAVSLLEAEAISELYKYYYKYKTGSELPGLKFKHGLKNINDYMIDLITFWDRSPQREEEFRQMLKHNHPREY